MEQRRVFRATGITIVMAVVVVITVLVTVLIGSALPENAKFTPWQAATIWAIVVLIGLCGLAAGLSKVVADDEGIIAVNGFKKHTIAWQEVERISIREGAPWPTVVLKDDREIALFAIQGTDGRHSVAAARWRQGHVT